LGLKKGLIIGSALGRGRSRYSGNQYSGNYQHSTRQSSCHYERRNHYDTHTYSGCYAQPNKYYYSSTTYKSHNYYNRRGKRAIAQPININMTEWYEDMSIKDQDDCGKRMVCELRAKEARSARSLNNNEQIIADSFGSGGAVDVSKVEVEFELAAQIGKNMGEGRCAEIYSRCDVTTAEIIEMIEKEFEEFEAVGRNLALEDVDELIDEENNEIKELSQAALDELKSKNIDPSRIWGSR